MISDTMTDKIRAELRAELARQGKSYSKIAEEIDTDRNQVSRMIGANRENNSGALSDVWLRLLDKLGYELVIRKKGEA